MSSGLMRFAKIYSLLNTSVSAGFTTPEIDVHQVEKITIYVESSVANTFTLQVLTGNGYKDYDSLSVSNNTPDFFEVWSNAWEKIKIKVANAATVSIEVAVKT